MAMRKNPKENVTQLKGDLENLCAMQCDKKEIKGFFGWQSPTLELFCQKNYKASFDEVYEKYSACGKASLRRSQWKMAEVSASMAIFLGKQYLGQRENVAVDTNARISFSNGAVAIDEEMTNEEYDEETND